MRLLPACCVLLLTTPALTAEPVDYAKQIKPLLQERCYACHGVLKQEAGLRLDTAGLMHQGSENGAVLKAGSPDRSELFVRISSTELTNRMPPEGAPLSAEEIELVKHWIEQGAQGSPDEKPETDPSQHWAFLPPQLPHSLSSTPAEGPTHPIDQLLSAKRQRQGLRTVPEVQKSLLLRRLSLDLTGLPPTAAELQRFLADDSPEAYENEVVRLLSSPHYGERWGRHWMDIWRYSDWYGLGAQLRNSQKHIWHWRDWIIESLNEDRGYDRMILEMLAADEIAPTDHDTLRAGGFLARNYYLFNRTTWLDTTIEHTGKAFLGLTFNCAKCHDHKYDPISQVNYYQMRAIFEPHQVRLDPLPGTVDLEKDGLPRPFDLHPEEPTWLHIRGDEKQPDKSRPIQPGVPGILEFASLQIEPVTLPAAGYQPALQEFVLRDRLELARSRLKLAEAALQNAGKQLAEARQRPPQEQPDPEAVGKIVLQEDFNALDDALWEAGAGERSIEAGKLIQKQLGATRGWIRTRQPHPANFEAILTWRTTGGEQWKSVGLSFDVAEGQDKLVYLSAVASGSKLQVTYNAGAGYVYPAESGQSIPVSLNTDYTMTVRVRDRLVNVALNGKHLLAYHLPVAREAGRMDLVCFDAIAEFDSLVIRELPSQVPLVEPKTNPGEPTPPQSIEQAEAAVQVAEATLQLRQVETELLQAVHLAERGKYRTPPAANLEEMVTRANELTRQKKRAELRERLAKARLQQLSEPDQQKTAQEQEAARKALEQFEADPPSLNYEPWIVTSKALEGPADSNPGHDKIYPATSTGRRTALAKWLTDRRHPLTARVCVNHLWLRHFGQPLVDPVDDFGRRTPAPAQQEVLDFLAVELMENQWSMKHLHRLIVTSRAYQLSTAIPEGFEQELAADAGNQFYWRRLPVRMEAEVIRDSLLQLAGTLNPQLGGPTISPNDKSANRRTLYFTRDLENRNQFVSMFDDADVLACYRRQTSIVPQQALALANSELSLQLAGKIADQLSQAAPDEPQFLQRAWLLLLGRAATEAELQSCREAMREHQTLLEQRGNGDQTRRIRTSLVHALLNHNDFVTIR